MQDTEVQDSIVYLLQEHNDIAHQLSSQQFVLQYWTSCMKYSEEHLEKNDILETKELLFVYIKSFNNHFLSFVDVKVEPF